MRAKHILNEIYTAAKLPDKPKKDSYKYLTPKQIFTAMALLRFCEAAEAATLADVYVKLLVKVRKIVYSFLNDSERFEKRDIYKIIMSKEIQIHTRKKLTTLIGRSKTDRAMKYFLSIRGESLDLDSLKSKSKKKPLDTNIRPMLVFARPTLIYLPAITRKWFEIIEKTGNGVNIVTTRPKVRERDDNFFSLRKISDSQYDAAAREYAEQKLYHITKRIFSRQRILWKRVEKILSID